MKENWKLGKISQKLSFNSGNFALDEEGKWRWFVLWHLECDKYRSSSRRTGDEVKKLNDQLAQMHTTHQTTPIVLKSLHQIFCPIGVGGWYYRWCINLSLENMECLRNTFSDWSHDCKAWTCWKILKPWLKRMNMLENSSEHA